MAEDSGVQAALQVLEDNTISYLMRSENYRSVENAISSGELLPPHRMKRLLQIFAHDLKQDTKYAVTILKLLSMILEKMKLGEHAAYPELLTTATGIMDILSKTAPLHKVQSLQHLCLEVLLAFPADLYVMLGTVHTADLLALVDQYLSTTNNVEVDIKIMIMDTIGRVLEVLPDEERKKFVKEGLSVWFSRLIPLVFATHALKQNAVNITETLIPDLTLIDYGDHPQWITLFRNISDVDNYPAALKTMLTSGDTLWHRAWCCVVKLLGTKLHKSAGLINSLLAVLESAFKMNIVDRCRAFQCWKVLIENFSLNMEQFFTNRRIKLLLIPLIVNNAKEENSASAKFDTWWFLLGLLQPKIEQYMDSIVVPFLHFCFGQLKPAKGNHVPPIVPGLTFPKVQTAAIQAIIEVMGHDECSGCVFGDFRKLDKPILNPEMLMSHLSHWMHATREATILFSKLTKDKAEQNINCLWRSLLKHISAIDDHTKQEAVYKEFVKMFSQLVLKSQENSSLAHLIFNDIVPCLFNKKSEILQLDDKYQSRDEIPSQYLFQLLLCPAFNQFYSPCSDESVQKLRTLTDLGVQRSVDGFSKWLLQELPAEEHSLTWWTSLVKSIVNESCSVSENTAKDIFIWPITKLEYFTDVQLAAQSWSEIFITQSLPKDSLLHLDVLNILMLHYKDTSVYNVFAVQALPLTISSVLENNPNKVVSMEKELSILSDLCGRMYEIYPQIDLGATAKCLSHTINALSVAQRSHTEIIKNAVTAANSVLKGLLTSQATYQNANESNILILLNAIKKLFVNDLYELIVHIEDSLIECSKTEMLIVRKTAHDVINIVLRNGYKSKALSSVLEINKIPDTDNVENKPLNSNLTTPNTKQTPNKPRSTGKIMKKVVDGDEEFVVVKSNWKFNPNKLTEHQKEVLKKMREDIPALYQDLSQSQDELKMKTWKVPDYSDSQDVSTSVSTSLDKYNTTETSMSNILKDIPNREVCPNVMKSIMNEDDKINEKNLTIKANVDTLKENSEREKANLITPKALHLKNTPRMSLKDKLNKNLQNLLGNTLDKNVVPSDMTPSMNKTLNVQNPHTSELTTATVLSAPPKLDSERPSRTKRKPKKLEEDFEILTLVKRKRNSLDSDGKLSDNQIVNQNYKSTEMECLPEDDCEIVEPQNIQEIDGVQIISDKVPEKDCIPTPACSTENETREKEISHTDVTVQSVERDNHIGSDNRPENTPKYTPKPKSKQIADSKLFPSKKKNRLETQLAIDMVEGHPLLTPKEDTRSTRKSRLLNESLTKRGIERSNPKEKMKNSFNSTPHIDLRNSKLKTSTIDKMDSKYDSDSADVCNDKADNVVSSANHLKSLNLDSTLPESTELPLSEDIIESSQDSPVSTISIKSSRRSNYNHSDKKIPKPNNKSRDCSSLLESEKNPGAIGTNGSGNSSNKKLDILLPTDTNNDKLDQGSEGVNIQKTTLENLSDDTIASMDTQPVTTDSAKANAASQCDTVEELRRETDTQSEIDTQLPELHDLNNYSNLDASEVRHMSDQAIAEMDTEPVLLKIDIPKIDLCSDDIIVIDDNSCDVNVPPTVNLDSDTEVVAGAEEAEPVQNHPSCDIGTSKRLTPALPEPNPIENSLQDEKFEDENSENSAPSSPFQDNKERNNEFLNNTFDISPIKVASPQVQIPSPPASDESSNDFVVITLTSPVKCNGEPMEKCDSPEIFTNDKISPDKREESPPRVEVTGSTGSPSTSLSLKKNRTQVRPSGRGAQMLGLCIPRSFYSKPAMNTDKSVESEESNDTPIITPARRNLKIAYGTGANDEPRPAEVPIHVENFLNLTKELPSATSSPAGPILKRKLIDITDETTLSPASKRKRVSFHDPPVSTTVSVQKYIEDSCIRSPQQNKNKDRKNRPVSGKPIVKKLENDYPEPTETKNVDDADDIEMKTIDTSETDVVQNETATEDTEINSLVDTPIAVIVARDQLTSSGPIYPELVDCTDPIANVISELTTDSMKEMFLRDSGSIATIGDLAKLTELEVNRLSIKAPKVETARAVLTSYTSKVANVHIPKLIEVSHMEIQTEFEEEFLWVTLKERSSKEVIEACLEKKPDFIEEFSNIVCPEVKQKIARGLPTVALSGLLCDRLKDTDNEESDLIFTSLVQKHPQQFLNKTFNETGTHGFLEKLGVENLQEYLLQNLTPGELVKFCSTILQKKIPSD